MRVIIVILVVVEVIDLLEVTVARTLRVRLVLRVRSIGVARSFYGWSLGIEISINLYWTYETVIIAHILLSGFSVLAAFWHWTFWDLNIFVKQYLNL